MLKSEHSHLLSLKSSLEGHLRNVKQQLQDLNTSRSNITAVLQERSRATDLLCQFMGGNAGSGTPGRAGNLGSVSFQKFPPSSLPPLQQASSSRLPTPEGQVLTTFRGAKALHSKAYSAPAPLEIGKGFEFPTGMERSASEAELSGIGTSFI